ncbi:PREDICTED: uncharacterized protein LOC107185173 isoform X2 [Myotis davidii]|uniref:uncharacterized protein LOC107185173 isoform X2 n=1 Tax=Myotis davidii TaxID=225400 RepID=UPI000767959D|nr:PREDICTED: uncharacterized protein LOC107185173 isoform X2 [Myotis davidii]
MMLPKYIWLFSAKLTSEPWGSSRCWLDFVLASPQAHPQNLQFIKERPYRLLEGGDSEDREKDGSVPVMPIFTREETEAPRRRVHGNRGERERGPVPGLPDAGAGAWDGQPPIILQPIPRVEQPDPHLQLTGREDRRAGPGPLWQVHAALRPRMKEAILWSSVNKHSAWPQKDTAGASSDICSSDRRAIREPEAQRNLKGAFR